MAIDKSDTETVSRRILIEVTDTTRTGLNTGIQRVCRKVCENAISLQEEMGVQCIPVSIDHARLNADYSIVGKHKLDDRLFLAIKNTTRFVTNRILAFCRRRSSLLESKVEKLATRLRKLFYPKAIVRTIQNSYRSMRATRVEAGSGDILLLIDSSWNFPTANAIERAQQNGCLVVPVIHDLIPILYQDFHQEVTKERFTNWFNHLADKADHFMAVSNSSLDDVKTIVRQRGRQASTIRFESFRLGADFRKVDLSNVSSEIQSRFASDTPVFLSVGTVEPRKNHGVILDAFERLWNQGIDAKWVLAGKPGWMSEDLHERIKLHPENGKRLFWFTGASDDEIGFMYRSARAFIFPSIIEGFGLPIVEAMSQGTPVIASDTRIHREVGGKLCEYFNLDETDSLVGLIEQHASRDKKNSIEGVQLTSWLESCRQLIGKSLDVLENRQLAKDVSKQDRASAA